MLKLLHPVAGDGVTLAMRSILSRPLPASADMKCARREAAVSSEGIGVIIRETYVPPSPNLPTSLLASHTSAAV